MSAGANLHHLHYLHDLPETSLDFVHEGSFGEMMQVMQVMQVIDLVGARTGHVGRTGAEISSPGAGRLVVCGVSGARAIASPDAPIYRRRGPEYRVLMVKTRNWLKAQAFPCMGANRDPDLSPRDVTLIEGR